MITDLEVWLIGSPADVAGATAALAQIGRIADASRPQTLAGGDAGRVRAYRRVALTHVAAVRPVARDVGPAMPDAA